MVEPISDDELQRLRELWNYLRGFDADYRVSERVGPLLRLLARLDAAESRAAELQREVERARDRCDCGAFNPDPTPESRQPCGCEFISETLVPCPRHLVLGRLPAVRFTDGSIHHYDEHGNCYAESGAKPC